MDAEDTEARDAVVDCTEGTDARPNQLERRHVQLTVAQRRAVWAAAIGNAVEFYDWAVYGTFVAIFSPLFFVADDDVTSLLAGLAVFAVGFVARPVGAVVLGSYADRVGRKRTLIIAVTITSFAALVMAVLPSYESIGVLAPITLITARLAQGFAAGGEASGSMTYLAEMAPAGRRGFIGSFQQVSSAAGILAASLMGTLLTNTLPPAVLTAWGWRIAFVVAFLLGLVGFVLRRAADETDAFVRVEDRAGQQKRHSAVEALQRNPKQMLQVFGLGIPATTINYLWLTYMPTLAHTMGGIPLGQAMVANTIALALTCCILPLCGAFSDRFGRKTNLYIFTLGFVACSYPAVALLGVSLPMLVVVQLIGAVLLAFDGAIIASQYNELFPTQTRAAGTAIPYALSVAMFGGTAPYVVTWLATTGRAHWIGVYVGLVALVGFLTTLTLPETSRRSLEGEHEDTKSPASPHPRKDVST